MPRRRARPADAPPLAAASDVVAADDPELIADRVHSAAIHLLRRLRREDSASGLSAPRLSALSVLVFGGPLTLGELASAEQVRPPTMTRLVSALEAQGFAIRRPDPSDGRVTRIHATAKGRSLLLRGRARRVAALAAEVRSLSPADRQLVARAVLVLEGVIARLS